MKNFVRLSLIVLVMLVVVRFYKSRSYEVQHSNEKVLVTFISIYFWVVQSSSAYCYDLKVPQSTKAVAKLVENVKVTQVFLMIHSIHKHLARLFYNLPCKCFLTFRSMSMYCSLP